jgi:phospholipase C
MSSQAVAHIVVIVFENRSFDHMLGFLSGDELSKEMIPVDPNDPSQGFVSPFILDSHDDVSVDPGHSYPDVMEQLTGSTGPWPPGTALTNQGFVCNYAGRAGQGASKEVVGCYDGTHVPVLWTLAREYAVCTGWFCSVPSETWPNRLFVHAATSDDTLHNDIRLYWNETVFEQLDAIHHDWRVYAGDIPQVAAFARLLWHPFRDRFDRLDAFFEDARRNRLPAYSFIEPRHFLRTANSQHPLQQIRLGEQLLQQVYEALAANPKVWRSSLLIITHDEHGGFYDRQPPPSAVPPSPDSRNSEYDFGFDLLGPRVPAVVVSPYIPAGTVRNETYDHTSIIATVREAFGLAGPLTDRDAAARSLLPLLTLSEPREPVVIPAVPAEEVEEAIAETDENRWAQGRTVGGEIKLNELQESLVRLKQLLDREQTGADAPTIVPEPRLATDEDVENLVADFQLRHIDPS